MIGNGPIEHAPAGTTEAERRAAGLAALVEIGTTIARQLDFAVLLATIDEQIARLIPSENAALYLIEPGSGDLVAERMRQQASGIPARIPRGHGLTGWVAAHGKPYLSNDIPEDPRFYDITNRQGLPQAILIAPLPGLERPQGAICLARFSGEPFTPLDRDLLIAFGQQAGVVLDQARLRAEQRRRADELAALNAIAVATATLDLDQVLRELVARTRAMTGADACAIDLLDETGTILTMRALNFHGAPHPAGTAIPLETSASGKIIRTGRPLIWDDAELGTLSLLSGPGGSEQSSLIGAPLIVQGRIIGTILASRLVSAGFGPDHLRFLETVAAQAAMAVENARLHSATEAARAEEARRAAGMAALVEIGAAIAAQHDYAALLATIDAELSRLIPSDSAGLLLVDPGTGDLVADVINRGQRGKPSRVPRGEGISAWVIEHGQPLLVNDIATDGRLYTAGRPEPVPHAMVLAPLPGARGTQGVIVLARLGPPGFTPLDRDLLAAFGQQAGVVLDQARLRAAQKRRADELAALNAIAVATATLDLDQVLRELVARTRAMIAAETCAITLLDESGTTLTARAADGLAASLLLGTVLPLDGSFSGEIIRSPRALLWRDARTSQNRALLGPHNGHERPASMIGVPLIAHGRTIGAMIATLARPNGFTEEHLRFAEMVGAQATLAVENARLYADTLRLTRYDPLTGLANRRYFIENLASAVAVAERHARALAVLMIDVDRFKEVNDAHGHLAGDAVLRAIAGRVRRGLRAGDLPARYAGDELAVIVPETDGEGAVAVAERLRAGVADAPITLDDGRAIAMTLSIGVGSYRPGNSADDLLHAADSAMYRAKQRGRNRVHAPA